MSRSEQSGPGTLVGPGRQTSGAGDDGSGDVAMTGKRTLPRRVFGVGRTLAAASRGVPSALRRLLVLPPADRRVTIRALAALVVVEASIRWTRIPRLATVLGVRVGEGTSGAAISPGLAPDPGLGDTAQLAPVVGEEPGDVGDGPATDAERLALRSTLRVIRRWPFGTGPCLRESLVLGHLLRSQEPVLCFGVTRRRGRLMAHAWIEIDGRPINDPQGVVPLRQAAR